MTINDCLMQYRNQVLEATVYLQKAFDKNPDGTFCHPPAYRSFIVNAAFLKFYIAWEEYLEKVMSAFLLGELPITGISIEKSVVARGEKHAHDLLVGTNTYFDWSNPELIRRLSKLYLEESNVIGDNILSIQNDLLDLKTIRNAAAHISATTQKKLDSLASRLLSHTVVDITVESLITQLEPSTGLSYFEYYKQKLDVVAEKIAKGEII